MQTRCSSCSKRFTADQCLRHQWIRGIIGTNEEEEVADSYGVIGMDGVAASVGGNDDRSRKNSLNAAKQNLSSHKEHWEEQHNHEFLFDRPSKTISAAAHASGTCGALATVPTVPAMATTPPPSIAEEQVRFACAES